jgi:hypothetical protein
MSTAFDSILTADAAAFLADFGEDVTYTPSGGTPRTIKAIVDRRPAQTRKEAGEGFAAQMGKQAKLGFVPDFTITVANDATIGISKDELTLAEDTITFSLFQTSRTYTILDMPTLTDAGLLTWEM